MREGLKELLCFTCNFRKVLFFWNGFLSKNTHRRNSTRLTVCLGFVARATAWVTVEVFFDGLFRHFLFSRFLHSQIYCWKGVHPSTVPKHPILCLWTSLFFFCVPTFFAGFQHRLGRKDQKRFNFRGKASKLELPVWKKNRFQYGFNCFFPHCQGSIDWGLRFEDWIEMKWRLRRPDWRLRVCQLRLEEPVGAGLFVVCSTRSFSSFFRPATKKQKKKKKEPAFGVVSSFI